MPSGQERELLLEIVLAGLILLNTFLLQRNAVKATRQRTRIQEDVKAIKGNGHTPESRTRATD